jgi:hypothetical protein
MWEYTDVMRQTTKPSMDAIPRAIIGFHQDEAADWVADLECGHTQHVRHNPPWVSRPWVCTAEGRAAHLGRCLNCKACLGAPDTGADGSALPGPSPTDSRK